VTVTAGGRLRVQRSRSALKRKRLRASLLSLLVRLDPAVAPYAPSRGGPMEIYVYADRVIIRSDGAIVSDHCRCFGRAQTLAA